MMDEFQPKEEIKAIECNDLEVVLLLGTLFSLAELVDKVVAAREDVANMVEFVNERVEGIKGGGVHVKEALDFVCPRLAFVVGKGNPETVGVQGPSREGSNLCGAALSL